jgi:4-hydroxybenzoate polyprenyltransferase
MIVFLQWSMHACIIRPLLFSFHIAPSTPDLCFWLLAMASVLIAAGGYVVNDYFDTRIDEINRPDRVIVNKSISKKAVMLLYQLLSVSGALLGVVIAFWAKNSMLGFLFVGLTGLLWFYSASYKRQFLIGNFIVAIATGLTPFIVGLLEIAFLRQQYGELLDLTPVAPVIYTWIGGFSLFAFLITLIREIVKDLEDVEGDRELECRTMAVVWGATHVKWVIYGLMLVVLSIAGYYVSKIHFVNDSLTLRYYIIGVVLPFLCFGFLVARAKAKTDFHQAATLLKFIMIIGICYSFVFYFLQAKTYGFPMFDLFMVTAQ